MLSLSQKTSQNLGEEDLMSGLWCLFFPVNKGRKNTNAVSRLCHCLTEAGAQQTHRHIVLESAISFPFFPLIPLRKGQGKAPLENKLVSQRRGSSADGSVVLHTLVQLWSTQLPVLNLSIVQMFSCSRHLEERRWPHLHFPQKEAVKLYLSSNFSMNFAQVFPSGTL